MKKEEYSEKEIEEVVKAFIVFIKKIINHSAIDYARKVKSRKYREILYSDLIDSKVSLSNYDNGTFLFYDKEIELKDILSKNIYKKAIEVLTDSEREILYLYANKMTNKQIALKMNLKEQTIKNKKNIAKNKLKNRVEELKNEEGFN